MNYIWSPFVFSDFLITETGASVESLRRDRRIFQAVLEELKLRHRDLSFLKRIFIRYCGLESHEGKPASSFKRVKAILNRRSRSFIRKNAKLSSELSRIEKLEKAANGNNIRTTEAAFLDLQNNRLKARERFLLDELRMRKKENRTLVRQSSELLTRSEQNSPLHIKRSTLRAEEELSTSIARKNLELSGLSKENDKMREHIGEKYCESKPASSVLELIRDESALELLLRRRRRIQRKLGLCA